MNRRQFLQTTTLGGTLTLVAGSGLLATDMAHATDWPKSAFDATSEAQALQLLFGHSKAIPTDKVTLDIPDHSDGSAVPVKVHSSLSGIELIAILTPKNTRPLNTFIAFSNAAAPFSTRIRVARTSPVNVYLKAGDKLYIVSSQVRIKRFGGYGMNL